jgi:hypothetical protein
VPSGPHLAVSPGELLAKLLILLAQTADLRVDDLEPAS